VFEIGYPSQKRGVSPLGLTLEARFESVPLHVSVETVVFVMYLFIMKGSLDVMIAVATAGSHLQLLAGD
jgi:hypothetical protein